ncbi:MAG: uracil-DNA glycosylase [Holosporaceae bacterium]|jgi:DNA polymerase|nr:uracil-DNA glycosylase [Holosporaceae bacterium]
MNEKALGQILEWLSDAGISDIIADVNSIPVEIKKEVMTLSALKEMISRVDTPLRNCAINMVFGVGNEKADILLLGEAPGVEEDRQGIPFVGQSGRLLDKILAAVGLDRTKVYITNILPWRPPGNRTPTNQEIEQFRPYVLKHISLINPKVIICLGGTAAKALLQTSQGIMQLRGKWTRIDEISAKIIPTFHPAYLLRSPSQKMEAWLDFLNAIHWLENSGT